MGRTFGSHGSDWFDELAVEADSLIVLGRHADEVLGVRAQTRHLHTQLHQTIQTRLQSAGLNPIQPTFLKVKVKDRDQPILPN